MRDIGLVVEKTATRQPDAFDTVSGQCLPYRAPAARAGRDELLQQLRSLRRAEGIVGVIDRLPVPAALLNPQRQVLHANEDLERKLAAGRGELLGLRLGDAAHCRRAAAAPDGCGTGPACAHCGLGRTLSHVEQSGGLMAQECRIATGAGATEPALDLRVQGSRLLGGALATTLVVLEDIAHEKRRQALERTFFHDVLNTLSGVSGYLQLWRELPRDEAEDLVGLARQLSLQAVEEVLSQRDLLLAEGGDLVVNVGEVDVPRLLEGVCAALGRSSVGQCKTLVHTSPPSPPVVTDGVLLRRVAVNLVKNALEASGPDEPVTVGWAPGSRRLTVHNEAAMTSEVRAQVFQRSFSTKAASGRGIGTHSVRLLTERYLGGGIEFTSDEGRGTTFRVTLPPDSITRSRDLSAARRIES